MAKMGECFSPGKRPSHTHPKSVYWTEAKGRKNAVFFCFFSLDTKEKKRKKREEVRHGKDGRMLFPGKKTLPHPPEKRVLDRSKRPQKCGFLLLLFS